ncbi:hypothetical protein [Spirosoma migulaei]
MLALNELCSTLSVTDFQSFNVDEFCNKHSIATGLFTVLLEMGFVQSSYKGKYTGYRVTKSLHQVTPQQAIKWVGNNIGLSADAAQKEAIGKLTAIESESTAVSSNARSKKPAINWHSPKEEQPVAKPVPSNQGCIGCDGFAEDCATDGCYKKLAAQPAIKPTAFPEPPRMIDSAKERTADRFVYAPSADKYHKQVDFETAKVIAEDWAKELGKPVVILRSLCTVECIHQFKYTSLV